VVLYRSVFELRIEFAALIPNKTGTERGQSPQWLRRIWACYKQWGDKGAFFLTEPLENHGREWRCYMRDPDGYLIEVGQYTEVALDWFNNRG